MQRFEQSWNQSLPYIEWNKIAVNQMTAEFHVVKGPKVVENIVTHTYACQEAVILC